ncbi:MAG: uracil-DNA glycosylase family protein, partial [Rikenellaceae bacterium]|nr:uracil-DNA glycosylase family protein [Rikenellaceae bacterium]
MENLLPERHPLEPFTPEGARVLMLGSFPPPRARWSMDFYYPNPQNDMWRVMGLVFYGDKDRFAARDAAGAVACGFDRPRVEAFCTERGIALSDTAVEVVRLAGNASDDLLQIVVRRDIAALLARLPQCTAVVTTGQKATETLFESLRDAGAVISSPGGKPALPAVGSFAEATLDGRTIRLWRMPSTSRAYPLPIARKAEAYARMF